MRPPAADRAPVPFWAGVSVPRVFMETVAAVPAYESPVGFPCTPTPAAADALKAEVEGLLASAGIDGYVWVWVATDVHTWDLAGYGVWVWPAKPGPIVRGHVLEALLLAGLVCQELDGGSIDVTPGE